MGSDAERLSKNPNPNPRQVKKGARQIVIDYSLSLTV